MPTSLACGDSSRRGGHRFSLVNVHEEERRGGERERERERENNGNRNSKKTVNRW